MAHERLVARQREAYMHTAQLPRRIPRLPLPPDPHQLRTHMCHAQLHRVPRLSQRGGAPQCEVMHKMCGLVQPLGGARDQAHSDAAVVVRQPGAVAGDDDPVRVVLVARRREAARQPLLLDAPHQLQQQRVDVVDLGAATVVLLPIDALGLLLLVLPHLLQGERLGHRHLRIRRDHLAQLCRLA
eukprot:1153002-Prymnesium_polylepis.1